MRLWFCFNVLVNVWSPALDDGVRGPVGWCVVPNRAAVCVCVCGWVGVAVWNDHCAKTRNAQGFIFYYLLKTHTFFLY